VNTCDKSVNWINNNHYTQTCSSSCAQHLKKQTGELTIIQEKIKATTMARYGVPNALQNPAVQAKRNQTLLEKYGALVSPNTRASTVARSQVMNKKGRQTLETKYGVTNPSQIPGVHEKKTATMMANHGVYHPSLIPHVQQARLDRRINRYQHLVGDVATILSWNSPSQYLQDAYDDPNPRIEFRCTACDNVEQLAMETFRWRIHACGTPCIKCSQINKGSLQERELREYVKSLGVAMISNDRQQLHPQELDILLPDHNLAIEYCGLYWHSELHGKHKSVHLDKMNKCSSQGIRLVTIFEDEWLHKSQVVKDRIRNMLGRNTQKIGARSLICESITSAQANKFCADYHIQGVGKTVHAYGLYQDQELLSVMTFSALTPAKGSLPQPQVWELNRLCTRPNLTISGGASRMFCKFVRDINPQQVISYSDRRWNTGHVYAQLGFDRHHDAPPNYWYIDFKAMLRIHRYNLRKNAHDNPDLTEWENRKLQGWNRIWDCGNTKWIWKNKNAE
jgi:hypothetical protein